MKLQNADTARHTEGTGSSSLMIPAMMIGTEQAIVTRIVKMMLNSKVIAASNLDMMSFFRWLAVRARPTRRRWALILPEKQQSIGAFTPSFDRFYPDAEDFSNIAH
ncbi:MULTISPECIES: hypothetical protein [Enterobacter cloacae complex]|jgi:hypothetical protein|uniref:hypothetical protein n=2 Tax=Enterobacteriaceae TaxID=543 RepID=UPI001CEF7F61|nr:MULTISPECIES: hypothetical protein [Enterobacter cloacae complex]MDU4459004.1 hypothetical protein [Enterobacter sp.]MCM7506567.1 hypothetical protein [Enterobacter kobei]MCM7578223.1 hypothetical protein [Enterobacter kobei]MCR2773108.1 hypothetical protein [Enterobacter kobei]MDA4610325.1 hypothetical protein [Enterobacter kobei]